MVSSPGHLLTFADPPPGPADTTLLRVTRRAMATTFEITLPADTPHALAAAEDALDLVDELEDRLTVYRDTSEVSRLNAAAADTTVRINADLFGLLATAAGLTRDTAGAFDIATGALIKAWGFFRREGKVPPAKELAAARACSGMRHVILNSAENTVKFRTRGLELNLGAIGKGFALDRVGERLRTHWNIRSALVHAGGSSALAIGTPPGRPNGWPIAVRHPADDQRTLGTVHLNDRALGTSAATYQCFEHRGKMLGHLLDPRTGWPASGTACASVVAATAAEADAYSTALFVVGPAEAARYCRPRPHLGAVILPDTIGAEPGTLNLSETEYTPPGLRELWRLATQSDPN